MQITIDKQAFKEYEKIVHNLADKLPQWNTEDFERKFKSSISSLLEEAGELSGLISKKRIRKHYWKADPKTLSDFKDIREQFMNEASDFLWVLVCSCYCLGYETIDIPVKLELAFKDYSDYDLDLEQTLFDVFSSIILMDTANLFEDRNIGVCLEDTIYTFGLFLASLYHEYDISLDDLLKYNMSKLEHRYDKDGKRVDGK